MEPLAQLTRGGGTCWVAEGWLLVCPRLSTGTEDKAPLW